MTTEAAKTLRAQRGPGLEQRSDGIAAIVLSLAFHGVIVALLAWGWMFWRHERPQPTLAIEARVVNARSVPALRSPAPVEAPPPAAPETPPPPVTEEPSGPPPPTPEELAQRAAEREAVEAAQQREQAAREQQIREQQARERQAREQHERETRARAAEAQRAAEKREAAARAQAEQKRRQEAQQAQQRLEAQKRAAAQEQAQREADLRRSLAAEEQTSAARSSAASSAALASWQASIAARIRRAWKAPPTAQPGIECVLNVTQVPGGEVTAVSLGTCNGDAAVRESIKTAVYNASPLPPPPDPALFERNLVITFRPE